MADLLLDRVVAAVGDRYEIEGEIGRGGMAVVYRARDVRLRRPLALKVLPPDLAFRGSVRERFLREAETAARLSHPNIVPVYAADEVGGVAYLAMAFVDGETLGARLAREHLLAAGAARRVLAEVADALAYAHAHGVVHRDVKPDNVLLDRESGRAVVTDFGIARAAEADLRLTVTGVAVGTPAYMSPEQALGEHEVDGRSDLYSLGVVGYQMLTGVTPFQATSAAGMLMKHVGERPHPVREHRPDVPASLAAAVERALAKKPAERWADAAAFRAAVLDEGAERDAAVERAPAPPPPVAVRADPPPRPRAPNEWTPAAPPASQPRPNGSASPPPPPAPAPAGDWRAEQRMWQEQMDAQRREWRERERAQREAWRDYWRESWRGNVPAPPPIPGMPYEPATVVQAAVHAATLEERARKFRRTAMRDFALLAFLGVLNVVTVAASGVPFPWVIFPAIGIISSLRRRWRPLAREGLHFGAVMRGREPDPAGANGAAPGGAGGQGVPLGGAALERLVRRLHRRVYWAVGFALAAALTLAVAAGVDDDVAGMLVVILPGLAVSALGALRAARQVRRAGMRVGDALSSRWREAVQRADRRPRAVILDDEARRVAPPDVTAGPHGGALRQALDDRLTVRETLDKLAPEDRALIPDVVPTVDALVDRVAGLVASLHRIDGDVPAGLAGQIDERLTAARAEPPGAADRARKIQLLERQQASLADLVGRRAALAAQLESAQLVLQNIKLDLLKLRSAGVGAAIADVSTATQEARALSRDIKYALDAAAEVRNP